MPFAFRASCAGCWVERVAQRDDSHDWSFVQHNLPSSWGGDGWAAKPFWEWCPCLSKSLGLLDTGNDLVGGRATIVHKWSSNTGWFCCTEQENVLVSVEIKIVWWAALKLRVSFVWGSPGLGWGPSSFELHHSVVLENEILSLNFPSFLPKITHYSQLLESFSPLSDDVAEGQAGKSKAFYIAVCKKRCFKSRSQWFKSLGFDVRPGCESRLLN